METLDASMNQLLTQNMCKPEKKHKCVYICKKNKSINLKIQLIVENTIDQQVINTLYYPFVKFWKTYNLHDNSKIETTILRKTRSELYKIEFSNDLNIFMFDTIKPSSFGVNDETFNICDPINSVVILFNVTQAVKECSSVSLCRIIFRACGLTILDLDVHDFRPFTINNEIINGDDCMMAFENEKQLKLCRWCREISRVNLAKNLINKNELIKEI